MRYVLVNGKWVPLQLRNGKRVVNNGEGEMKNQSFEEFEKEMLAFANSTTEVQSLLYDLDLMPEQIEKGSSSWGGNAQHFASYVSLWKENISI